MAQSRLTAEIERDRRNIARLYLQGETQASIAEQLGISQPTVSRDLKVIQGEWKEARIHDIDERKNIELAKIDNLELEYWEAWKRSCEDAEVMTVKKKGKIVNGNEQTIPVEAQKRTEGQSGDPRYLAGVQWCINKRCELLGLDAPKSLDVTSGNERIQQVNPYMTLSKEEIKQRLRELMDDKD